MAPMQWSLHRPVGSREQPRQRSSYSPVQLLSRHQTGRMPSTKQRAVGMPGPGAALMLYTLLREGGLPAVCSAGVQPAGWPLGATLRPAPRVHSLLPNDLRSPRSMSGHGVALCSALYKSNLLLPHDPCSSTKHPYTSFDPYENLADHTFLFLGFGL